MSATAEYKRLWRAERKAAGEPVKRGAKTRTKFDRAEFLAIDGEGCDDADGRHHYMMMCAAHSDGELMQLNGEPYLTADECLEWLTERGAMYPNAIAVVFSGTYDATMMLRGLLDKAGVDDLWKHVMQRHDDGSSYVRLGRWVIRYQPGKQLYVADNRTGNAITLWDVWGYFQSSFVRTLAQWEIAAPFVAEITAGKERRGDFQEAERGGIARYCLLEVRALVDLMTELHARLVKADLKVSRWDGAGSIGAALLSKHDVKSAMLPTPPAMLEAARCAYFGGRIELLQYGHSTEPVYRHDINSAYPAWARYLPRLAGGRWVHYDNTTGVRHPPAPMRLQRLRYRFPTLPADLYPLPYRYHNGQVIYPQEGEGWYWHPEARQAADMVAIHGGALDVLETWEFYPDSSRLPFAFLDDVFALRRAWKQEGEAAEYVLKLGMNSVYGKLAQQIGSQPDKPPPYHQIEWAGYITACVRAQLYQAAQAAPRSVIMLATDGIYASQELPVLKSKSKELGLWEVDVVDELIAVQSGVYWYKQGGEWVGHTRGFSADFASGDHALTHERVLDAWSSSAYTEHLELPCVSRRQFVSFGAVAAGIRAYEELGQWVSQPKSLKLYPTGKRWLPLPLEAALNPAVELVPTAAVPNQTPDLQSAPHRPAFSRRNGDRLTAALQDKEEDSNE